MFLKIVCLLILLLPSICMAQSRSYVIPSGECDGIQFMQRYNLSKGDFWMVGDTLFLKDSVFMPDNPPICDPAIGATIASRMFAKNQVDSQGQILLRAITSTLLDQMNVLRAATPHPLISLTRSGSTVTATTPVSHGLNSGDTVSIFGADQAGYAGQQTITGVTPNTFTFTIGTSPATPATGSILYVEGPIPGPTPQVTMPQAIQAIKNKIDSGAVDK